MLLAWGGQLARRAAGQGTHAELLQMAQNIVSSQGHEIEEMRT